ncbi:MAG: hypothetical protein JSW50_13660 [Candidatus Latescibacterota bacterium]|nr:MAG: hypothetical protein JSW50_13660 [Candidatus Latescibacterota bacterium]
MSNQGNHRVGDKKDGPAGAERPVVQPLLPDGPDRNGKPDIAPQVQENLEILVEACGSNLVAVVFFGSLLVGTSPTADSAADLFVVVDDYERFYRDLHARLPAARRASIMAALNRVLPPNIIYLRDPSGLRAGAKCFVIDRRDFSRSLSPESLDHFCRGRLIQRVQIVYSRTHRIRDEVEVQLESARRGAVDWVPLYLPVQFTVLEFCLRMLEVSYAKEIRPESRSRVLEVFEAQKSYFRLMYGRILKEAVADGRLRTVGERYSRVVNPRFPERLAWRVFFAKSKMRATVRWVKYMLTFDDWLDYITRKAERRTGLHLELTKAERRFPAILLWPKLFRVLGAMRAKVPSDPDRDAAGDRPENSDGGSH